MAAFIGIDLGTTYSAISYIDENGSPKIINNSEGENITPSCILIEGDTVIVGEEARKELGLSDNVLARFKRDMGEKGKKYEVDGKEYTPTDCSSLVLKKLFQDAQKEIGEIGDAVVTIPANFTNKARTATITAAKLAGLEVENIVDEPTAAALYYAFKRGAALNGQYAVYDLGGGTFVISIINVTQKKDKQDIDVLASEGVKKLGGDDFDTILQKIVKKKFKDEHNEKLAEQDYTKTEAEEDKKSLSKRENVNVRSNKKNIKVTRAEFEEKISSLVMQAEMLCESILNENNLTPEDLQEVFLVGGSTRVPCVEKSVERVFNKKPTKSINVDEAVVLGASLYAAYKGDPSNLNVAQKEAVDKIKVTDVTPSFFGTFAYEPILNTEDLKKLVSIIIDKNTPRPCSVTKSFYTMYEGQEAIDCTITSSDNKEEDPKFVTIEKESILHLPPDRPANLEIQITYSFDDNGVMQASFKDVESGKVENLKISPTGGTKSDSSNIDRFTVE